MTKLWRSGVIFSAAGFVAGIGNYVFQAIMGRLLKTPGHSGEFGYLGSGLAFINLLGLPLLIASTAVTHYIAHFQASGDEARLAGLLSGCRRFLFRLTVAGSIGAVLLIKPLSTAFEIPRPSLVLAALACALAWLWVAFANAICQGLGWFNRLALISLAMMALRVGFGWTMALKWPVAEIGLLATGVGFSAYLILLHWRKDLAKKAEAVSPYNREFALYLAVAAACITGGFCFTQGDILAAGRNFSRLNGGHDLDLYNGANKLGAALPAVVGPMLAVLFTSRSSQATASVLREQFKLLGLYAAGLAAGALGLWLLREFWVKMIFGRPAPESAAMLQPLTVTMAFVGLMQALGMWALASRWFRVALLYGLCGITYWALLLHFGKTPDALLRIMPVAAGVAFGLLLISWLATMRIGTAHDSDQSDQSDQSDLLKKS